MIFGKRLAAFPAPTTVVPGLFRFGMGAVAALPGPMRLLVALFRPDGGTGGRFAACPVAPAVLAEPLGEALADGLEDAERVVLALADAERAELVPGVGLRDAEPVGLGVGDVQGVGLGVGVGVGDTEGVGLALAVGVGVGVDGEAEGDADVDGDGLGVLQPLGLELVLGEDVDGDGVTALANAGPCAIDSPETRKPAVTRPATTARRCAR